MVPECLIESGTFILKLDSESEESEELEEIE
jgi:hypothetical protein